VSEQGFHEDRHTGSRALLTAAIEIKRMCYNETLGYLQSKERLGRICVSAWNTPFSIFLLVSALRQHE
jgi:hypothetical protein